MAADQIDISLAPPKANPAPGERSVSAERISAKGRVRMSNDRAKSCATGSRWT